MTQTVIYDRWYLCEQEEGARRAAHRRSSPPAPKPRVLDRREPCPRKALSAAIEASGHSYAAHSRMIGRWDGYLARFVNQGQPVALTEREHQLLADHFGLDHRGLGVRDLWTSRE